MLHFGEDLIMSEQTTSLQEKPMPQKDEQGRYIFTLSSYGAVQLELDTPQITEDEVRHYLEATMYQHADIVPVEEQRKPRPGDIVTLDLETFEGEEKFEPISGQDLQLELGINLMPPVFEDAICGLNKGDKAEISYEIAGGKTLCSKVVLKEINIRIIPALTDSWVEEKIEGCSIIPEFIAQVHTQLSQKKEAELAARKPELIADELRKRLEQSIPQHLIDEGYKNFKDNFEAMLKMQGSSREEFIQQQGFDYESMIAAEQQEARIGVERGIAMDAYAAYHKLEISDKEIPQLLGVDPQMSEAFVEALKKDGSLAEAKISALRNKALKDLLANSQISFKS